MTSTEEEESPPSRIKEEHEEGELIDEDEEDEEKELAVVEKNGQKTLSSSETDEDEEYDDDSFTNSDEDDRVEEGDGDDVIDELLDEYLTKQSHTEKTKKVLKKKGQDYFDVLPADWIEVTHFSGMPLYLHQPTRVCTFSKPYYIGTGSVKKHQIPVSAIPCLEYKRELEKEETLQEAKVENVLDQKCLSLDEVKEYCEKLFEFNEVKIRKFKTWADRRRYNAMVRERQPFLPSDTKLITCSTTNISGKKEFVMNPAGKSYVCILHEFVQHKEKVQPKYVYKESDNANTPYSATVVIKNTSYGIGYGNSKRQAKSEAAKKTIEVLIPSFKDIIEANNDSDTIQSSKDLSFFDNIKIEDSRISDLCVKAGQQSPYQILVECLKRNAGTSIEDAPISHDVKLIKPQKNIYTMTANGVEAKVTCKNKRDGKQRAAQAILQKLHPHVTSWGGLLLMYGRGSCKTPKEKKEQELKITELQNCASPNKPNYEILEMLKQEIRKLNH